MKAIKISACVLGLALLQGCAPKAERCWEPEVKTGVTKLLKDAIYEQLLNTEGAWKENETADQRRARIDQLLKIDIKFWHAESSDYGTKSLTCGARVYLDAQPGKSAPLHSESSFVYQVNPGEQGDVFNLQTTFLFPLITNLLHKK